MKATVLGAAPRTGAALETQVGPRRGRRGAIPDWWWELRERTGAVWSCSRRTPAHRSYRSVACPAPGSGLDPAFARMMPAADRRGQETIRVGWGRPEAAKTIRSLAGRIGAAQPSTPDAVALHRRWRTGRPASREAGALAGQLARVIPRLWARWPATSLEAVGVALEAVPAPIGPRLAPPVIQGE